MFDRDYQLGIVFENYCYTLNDGAHLVQLKGIKEEYRQSIFL